MEPAAAHPPAAVVRDIHKRFGGAYALRGVSITFGHGEVHAVAGENGAGKSTLMKILSGVIGADSYTGTVTIAGAARRFASIRDAERHGVFLVPQELSIVPELRVGEYLFLNREPQRFGLVDTRRLWSDTARWLDVFRLRVSPLAHMAELSTHEQQLVSIGRAMTQGVKVLILDEPTASLTERETELLFARIGDLHRHGVTTIYISHRLHEFERIADAVTVMRDGSVVDHFRLRNADAASGDTPKRVIRAMVGRELSEVYPKVAAPVGEPVLSIRNWSLPPARPGRPAPVRDVDLDLRRGEVVGIYGLLGSGCFDLARSLFTARPRSATGSMTVRGRNLRLANAGHAIRVGIAYLPAERKRDGLVTSHPIETNMTLAALGRLTWFGGIDRAAELSGVQRYIRDLRVRCGAVDQPIAELSGGNQQKVVAAKWLLTEPDVVILEEPTRGVDVNARVDFYGLINRLAASRKAIMLVSTDLPEVLGMADRVHAMHEGRLAGEWARGEASEEDVMIAASGGQRVAA